MVMKMCGECDKGGEHALEWISVKDRLPEEGIYVLAWDGNHARDNGDPYYEIAAYRTFGHGSFFVCPPYCLNNITHWMPLPKPPS